jgi:hypothetical protein
MKIAFSAFCLRCVVTLAWSQSEALVGSEPSPMEAVANRRVLLNCDALDHRLS